MLFIPEEISWIYVDVIIRTMWRKTETDNYQLLTIKHLSSIWAHSLCVCVSACLSL